MLKTYYCVTSSFDDRGRVRANLTSTVEAESCPESSVQYTSKKDIYNDWFESEKKALQFVEEAKQA